ncbi:MAG: hypothetical protein JNM58_08245 [Xanthomonadaceae bacterium]|nr:hypothetical protein [Xanthomonadaceae bacterium]
MSAAPQWDPVQREVLAALGHPLERLAIALPGGTHDIPFEWPDDPIVDALLRAAARRRDDADVLRDAPTWPSPQALRADPRAKRALWPRLRGLRRRDA